MTASSPSISTSLTSGFFAGIWETWLHDDKKWHSYTVLTTSPNKEMEPIHDRMPVILRPEDEAQWLAADTEEDIRVLLAPPENGALESYEVNPGVILFE